MNWFQRYGIPGTYFYIALLSGLYALYPCKIVKIDLRALATFAVSFLPVGYVITVFCQWIYLCSKRRGLHSQARNVCGFFKLCQNEADIEARSCLNAANDSKNLDAHKFIQDWIRKRMDVVTINKSMQVATVLVILVSFPLGYVLWGKEYQPKWLLVALLSVILIVIFSITLLCNRIIEKQIVTAITGDWTISVNQFKQVKASPEDADTDTDKQ